MKRKVYATQFERNADRTRGFLLFPTINIPLWAFTNHTLAPLVAVPGRDAAQALNLVHILPWLVNAIVLAWAFVARPEIAAGYLGFVGLAVTVVTILGGLFLAACFVSLASATVIGPLALIVFVAMMGAGMYYLARLARWLYTGTITPKE